MSKLGNLGALTGLEIEEEEEEDEVFDQTYEDHTTMEDDRQNSISIRCLFSPIFSFTLVLFRDDSKYGYDSYGKNFKVLFLYEFW